ncbi:MAG: hypothetical protein ACXW4Q_12940 [Anaerolineales bacterium]
MNDLALSLISTILVGLGEGTQVLTLLIGKLMSVRRMSLAMRC